MASNQNEDAEEKDGYMYVYNTAEYTLDRNHKIINIQFQYNGLLYNGVKTNDGDWYDLFGTHLKLKKRDIFLVSNIYKYFSSTDEQVLYTTFD